MYKEINKELKSLEQELSRSNEIDELVDALCYEIKPLYQKQKRLEHLFAKERNDYEKASEKSIPNLVHHLTGTLKSKTEKELGEFLETKSQYDQISLNIANIKKSIKLLEDEKNEYGDLDEKYKAAFKKKLAIMKKDNSKVAKDGVSVAGEIEKLEEHLFTIIRTIETSELVLAILKEFIQSYSTYKRPDNFSNEGKVELGFIVASINSIKTPKGEKTSTSEIKEMLSLIRYLKVGSTELSNHLPIVIAIDKIDRSLDNFVCSLMNDLDYSNDYGYTMQGFKGLEAEVISFISLLSQMGNEDKSEIETKKQHLVYFVKKMK